MNKKNQRQTGRWSYRVSISSKKCSVRYSEFGKWFVIFDCIQEIAFIFPIWKKKAIRENTDRLNSGLGSPENPQARMPALRRGIRKVAWHDLCSIEICRFLAYILLSGAALEPSTPPFISPEPGRRLAAQHSVQTARLDA